LYANLTNDIAIAAQVHAEAISTQGIVPIRVTIVTRRHGEIPRPPPVVQDEILIEFSEV
jgi:hypothetical protein